MVKDAEGVRTSLFLQKSVRSSKELLSNRYQICNNKFISSGVSNHLKLECLYLLRQKTIGLRE